MFEKIGYYFIVVMVIGVTIALIKKGLDGIFKQSMWTMGTGRLSERKIKGVNAILVGTIYLIIGFGFSACFIYFAYSLSRH